MASSLSCADCLKPRTAPGSFSEAWDLFFFCKFNCTRAELKRLQSLLSSNLTQLQTVTSGNETTSSLLVDNFKNADHLWPIILKHYFTILIVIVLLCSVVALYLTVDRHHSDSYDLAKKEEEAKKRLEMEGIYDVDNVARMSPVIKNIEPVDASTVIQIEEEINADPCQEVESEV